MFKNALIAATAFLSSLSVAPAVFAQTDSSKAVAPKPVVAKGIVSPRDVTQGGMQGKNSMEAEETRERSKKAKPIVNKKKVVPPVKP